MRELLFGGLLYLTGVAAVLYFRPTLIFTEEGQWKEFGIGRNPKRYTWMPFWLFCIFWALLSYAIISKALHMMGKRERMAEESLLEERVVSRRPRRRGLRAAFSALPAENKVAGDFSPGYYVLNAAATAKKGVPHYIYYGEQPPEAVASRGLELGIPPQLSRLT